MAIRGATTSVTAFVGAALSGPVDTPVRVTTFAEFEAKFGGLWHDGPMTYAVSHFFANGGLDALIVRTTGEGVGRGLQALEQSETFNLLCVPPFTLDGDVGPATRSQAAALVARRRAFYIVDPLAAWADPADIVEGASGLESDRWGLERSANAAVYFPRLRMPDPLRGGAPTSFMPCGAVAGIYARTDRERGVWKSPGGVDATLSGVLDLTVNLTAVQYERLNAHGVNGLRRVSDGHIVWGARTLNGADAIGREWKYVAVRRLFLFLEQSIAEGLQWAVFEPNSEPLWTRIRAEVQDFMQNVFRQGALQGRSPHEAYFVKCGAETTTQADLDAGVVNVVVGFAPVRPAEFVIISLRQIAGRDRTEGADDCG